MVSLIKSKLINIKDTYYSAFIERGVRNSLNSLIINVLGVNIESTYSEKAWLI